MEEISLCAWPLLKWNPIRICIVPLVFLYFAGRNLTFFFKLLFVTLMGKLVCRKVWIFLIFSFLLFQGQSKKCREGIYAYYRARWSMNKLKSFPFPTRYILRILAQLLKSEIPSQQELIYSQWISDVISTQETTLISWNCCQRLQQKSKEVKRSSIDLSDKVRYICARLDEILFVSFFVSYPLQGHSVTI